MKAYDLKSKVKMAQDAVKDVEPDLKKSAFEIILRKLLEAEDTTPTVKPVQKPQVNKRQRTAGPVSLSPIPLDLKGGKNIPSLSDFYKEKSPSSNQEKITVFAFYLNKKLNVPDVLPGHAISCYNEVHEKKPLNILALFKDTRRLKGWLETGEAPNSVRVSIAGENLVEHDLPRLKK